MGHGLRPGRGALGSDVNRGFPRQRSRLLVVVVVAATGARPSSWVGARWLAQPCGESPLILVSEEGFDVAAW